MTGARDGAVAGRRPRHRREHRRFGGVGALDRAGQIAAHPARDRAGVPAVLGQRQRDELLDQRLRLGRVDRGDRRHARDDRERALKLRLRLEAAAAVERADARRLPRRRGVRRRRADADALERPHQHAVAGQRAHGDEDVVARVAGAAAPNSRWPNAI